MPTGGTPISETATTPSAAGESRPEKSAAKKPASRFGPMRAVRSTIRNAPWVVIAVVLHVVAIATLSIMYVQHKQQVKDDLASAVKLKTEEKKPVDQEPEIKAPEIVDRKAIPKPTADQAAELVSNDTVIPTEVPTATDDSPEDLTKDIGDPTAGNAPTAGGGTALGVGGGGGRHGKAPSAYSGRGNGTGTAGRLPKGQTAKTEEAVLRGQVWLARHQQPDGSWSAAKMKNVCDAAATCCAAEKTMEMTDECDVGLTGLALLSYLGSGIDNTYLKLEIIDTYRGKRHYGGDIVKRGLNWLCKRQEAHPDGRFSDDGYMYNEALATLALSEAYGMTHQSKWKEAAQKGINFLVQNQRKNPSGSGLWGWRYEPVGYFEVADNRKKFLEVPGNTEKDWNVSKNSADISITTWVVMAFKSAELAGLEVPHESMAGAMDLVKYLTLKDGRVAYKDPLEVDRKIQGEIADNFVFHASTLSALGMCVRTFAEKNVDDPMLEIAAQRIVKDLPTVSKDKMSIDYYYWYYGTLALNQFDGPDCPKRSNKFWPSWNRALQDALVDNQEKEKCCAMGTWTAPDRWSAQGGAIYRTAINVLTLEIYYRYENAFGAAAIKKK